MNERNVAALDELFREAWREAIRTHEKINVRVHAEVARLVAEALAARGVLAPEALTLEQVVPVVDGWMPSIEEPDVAAESFAEFVADLARIAKGEVPPSSPTPSPQTATGDAKGGKA